MQWTGEHWEMLLKRIIILLCEGRRDFEFIMKDSYTRVLVISLTTYDRLAFILMRLFLFLCHLAPVFGKYSGLKCDGHKKKEDCLIIIILAGS